MIPYKEGASGAGSRTEDEIMSASLEQGALGASLDRDPDISEFGRVVWHSSDEDSGPDVGVTVGLGQGRALWFGEISNKMHEEEGDEAAGLGDHFGTWIILYDDNKPRGEQATVIGKAIPYVGTDVCDAISASLRASATPAPTTPPGVPDSVRALSEGLQHSFMVTRADHARERYRIEITCPGLVSMQDMHRALVAVQSGRDQSSASVDWREALTPFVAHYQPWMDEWADDKECTTYARVTFGDLRRLRTLLDTYPAGQSAGPGAEIDPEAEAVWNEGLIASEPCAWAGGNDTCYCRTCGEEYRYGREDKPACPKKLAPDSTRTGDEGTEESAEHAHFLDLAASRLQADGYSANAASCLKAAAYLRALAARPAVPEAQGAQGAWRPISTAPPNKAVQVYVPNHDYYGNEGVYAGMLVDMGTGQRWMTFAWAMGRDMCGDDRPTHWRPLPAPPASSGQEG